MCMVVAISVNALSRSGFNSDAGVAPETAPGWTTALTLFSWPLDDPPLVSAGSARPLHRQNFAMRFVPPHRRHFSSLLQSVDCCFANVTDLLVDSLLGVEFRMELLGFKSRTFASSNLAFTKASSNHPSTPATFDLREGTSPAMTVTQVSIFPCSLPLLRGWPESTPCGTWTSSLERSCQPLRGLPAFARETSLFEQTEFARA